MLGLKFPVCNLARCSRSRCYEKRKVIQESGNCFCDMSCQLFGDCCIDFELVCLNKTLRYYSELNETTDKLLLESASEQILSRKLSKPSRVCFRFKRMTIYDVHRTGNYKIPVVKVAYHMINECADNFTDEDIKMKCNSNQYLDDSIANSPAYTEYDIYINKYCALCNFNNISEINIFKPFFHCRIRNSYKLDFFYQNGTLNQTRMLRYRCHIAYNSPTHISFRHLDCSVTSIDHCPSSFKSDTAKGKTIVKACKAYSAYTMFLEDFVDRIFITKMYKNLHCAYCNGRIINESQCLHIFMPLNGDILYVRYDDLVQIPSFTSLMRLNQQRPQYITEPLLKFQTTTKPATSSRYENETNRGDISNVPEIRELDKEPHSIFQLTVMIIVNEGDNWNKSIFAATKTANAILVSVAGAVQLSKCDVDTLDADKQIHVQFDPFLTICRAVTFRLHKPLTYLNLKINDSLRALIATKSIECYNNLRVELRNYKRDTRFICHSGNLVSWHSDEFQLQTEQNNETMFIPKTNSTFEVNHALITYDFVIPKFCSNSSAIEIKFDYATVCGNVLPNCSVTFFNRTEYDLTGNDSIKVIKLGLRLARNQFEFREGGVIVCLKYVTLSLPDIENIIALSGIAASLISLVFTLMTYAIFPVLRNTAGKVVMNLAASLFSAQLLFATSSMFTDSNLVCKIHAILQHYAWLCAFTWTNILAIHVYLTFHKPLLPQAANKIKKHYLKLVIYGYMSPIFTVALCFCFHVFDILGVSYGGDRQCWLVGMYTIPLFFALPLAVLIAANIVLFSLTIVGLHKSVSQVSEMIRKSRYSEVTLYIKLSCNMGFTWIFGLLSLLTHTVALRYLFIVCNSFQGVFIFFTFVLNKRVYFMYCSCLE